MLHFDLQTFIKSAGLLGILLMVFAECGMMVGFFLPGDSLLFTAGFLASQQLLNIYVLVPLVILAAIIGNSTGYTIGRKLGKRLFSRENSKFFSKEHIEKAKTFYEKHGGKTVTLAFFVPIVRTFAPVVAGASEMEYRRFLAFNVAGAVVWGGGVTMLGYFLGSRVPGIDKYLIPIILLVIVLSLASPLLHMWRSRSKSLSEEKSIKE